MNVGYHHPFLYSLSLTAAAMGVGVVWKQPVVCSILSLELFRSCEIQQWEG